MQSREILIDKNKQLNNQVEQLSKAVEHITDFRLTESSSLNTEMNNKNIPQEQKQLETFSPYNSEDLQSEYQVEKLLDTEVSEPPVGDAEDEDEDEYLEMNMLKMKLKKLE